MLWIIIPREEVKAQDPLKQGFRNEEELDETASRPVRFLGFSQGTFDPVSGSCLSISWNKCDLHLSSS